MNVTERISILKNYQNTYYPRLFSHPELVITPENRCFMICVVASFFVRCVSLTAIILVTQNWPKNVSWKGGISTYTGSVLFPY